jgi:ATP-dependent RNA helicase DDX27
LALFYHKPNAHVRVFLLKIRELAIQCNAVIEQLAKYTNQIRSCLVTGGMSMTKQQAELRTFPDIIVATPGRLIDHLRNTQSFGLEGIEILVLDEADRYYFNNGYCVVCLILMLLLQIRLLEMGFIEEVEEIVKMCPKNRQTMLFSATMTEQVSLSLSLFVSFLISHNYFPFQHLAQ